MKSLPSLLCFVMIIGAQPAFARPISYPGGWMFMTENDGTRNAADINYTLDPTLALGLRSEYDRSENYQIHTFTMNNRLWRSNQPDAQANLYLLSGIGYAFDNGSNDTSPAAFTGIEADWENRRIFTSYQNKFTYAGDIDTEFSQSARIGIAPYIGESGDLHTWLMLQADHRPEGDHKFEVTPLIRLFKGTDLVEAGISNKGTVLFNYTHQF